jgi:protein-S-isoprenylcysteine O-methyltransferase Ste14
VRHPFYTAYILFWIAGGLAAASWAACAATAVMSAIYIHAALREESKFTGSPLSAEYAAYCRTAGFMWPRRR